MRRMTKVYTELTQGVLIIILKECWTIHGEGIQDLALIDTLDQPSINARSSIDQVILNGNLNRYSVDT